MLQKPVKIFFLFVALTVGFQHFSYGQLGGQYTYGVLNLNTSARGAALGGMLAAIPDPDASLVSDNPAYLGVEMDHNLGMSYVNYFSDIQYGRVSYVHQTKKYGGFGAGLLYLNYGSFIEANEYGDITGEFQAAEYSFDLSWGYRIDSVIAVGVSVKPIYSVFERYSSWGIATDASLLYLSPGKRTSAALVVRNMGTQLSTYASPEKEPLPFEIMAGFSQKIKHAPFRLLLSARNLQQFDLDVIKTDDPVDSATGKKIYDRRLDEIVSKSLDHLVAGVEFLPGKVIALRFGYNFRNRAELKLGTKNTASGLNFGLGINLGKFKIDYALANYHVAAISHLMTITTDLGAI